MTKELVKVLIADDDQEDFTIASRYLGKSSYSEFKTDWVGDYQAALEQMLQANHDIYILDYLLGPKTGLDLMREAKAKGCPGPFILLTGKGNHEVDLAAMKEGAFDFVCKDRMDEEVLERSIRYCLERQKMLLSNIAASNLATLGEISASLAHEVSNPLTIIYANAENLKKVLNKEVIDRPLALGFTEEIVQTTLRIKRIITSLQSFSSGNRRSECLSVSIKDVIEDTLSFCRGRFAAKGIPLQVSPLTDNLKFQCRPIEVSQALLNLLNNAFDAVENLTEKWVTLDVDERGDYIYFQISDSGTGISEELEHKIFQPFFTTKTGGKGTGLGLSVVERIVKAHNGRLYVNKQIANTCFVMQFPKIYDYNARFNQVAI